MITPEGDLKPAVCFACSYDPLVELEQWREHKPPHLVLRSELPQTPAEASLCTVCGNISGSSEGNKCLQPAPRPKRSLQPAHLSPEVVAVCGQGPPFG
jgi:hypothetical protein